MSKQCSPWQVKSLLVLFLLMRFVQLFYSFHMLFLFSSVSVQLRHSMGHMPAPFLS